jgi:protein-L-isoaspartate(D-aspartate) O-methyltransferase
MAKGHIALVNQLIKRGVLKTPSLIKSFKDVDRVNFVPKGARRHAYEDLPVPLAAGSTVSQPYTLALMLELLQPELGDRVLDIGSGSGWSTALLAKLVGKQGRVLGLEVLPELVKESQDKLKKLRLSAQAKIIQAKIDTLGVPGEKFNKILVSATADTLPLGLLEQLTAPGRLVMPIKYSLYKIDKLADGTIEQQEFPGFIFVPLV